MDKRNNVITVIQARTGSSRLPDKIFLPLSGKPLLIRMYERVKSAKLSGEIIVATTTDASDDKVEELCKSEDISCFRGHPVDLLDRHYKTALEYKADAIVKIPSDCPLISPRIIDKVIGYYINHTKDYDFVSNLHPATYPDGNDVEVIPFNILETAWTEAILPLEREHTTPYIWERPERFRIGNVSWETGLDYSMSHRFTIDYQEDYLFINEVYNELYQKDPIFGLNDILNLIKAKPGLMEINGKYAGVNWYRHHLNELKTISEKQTKKSDE
ncbi:acylneuraminate cytidylyltransferase [bacterium]|nr:MAG: acylneuraminate cytidylyltransferase [bacterium]